MKNKKYVEKMRLFPQGIHQYVHHGYPAYFAGDLLFLSGQDQRSFQSAYQE